MPIIDKFKDMGTVVMGKVESGSVREGDSMVVMPNKVSFWTLFFLNHRWTTLSKCWLRSLYIVCRLMLKFLPYSVMKIRLNVQGQVKMYELDYLGLKRRTYCLALFCQAFVSFIYWLYTIFYVVFKRVILKASFFKVFFNRFFKHHHAVIFSYHSFAEGESIKSLRNDTHQL